MLGLLFITSMSQITLVAQQQLSGLEFLSISEKFCKHIFSFGKLRMIPLSKRFMRCTQSFEEK